MDDRTASPGQAQPIGRGPKVRAAVLAATLAELADAGYAALTMEGVAQRAGVHKTTVYRRWKDREALVVDAMTDRAAAQAPIPDTHDIETDLRALARSLVDLLVTDPADHAGIAVMGADVVRIPELAEVKRSFYADRYRRAEPIITGAIERGQLPAGTVPSAVLKTLIAPIYLRFLVTAEPLDEAAADEAAHIALAAARAGVLSHPPDEPQAG